MKSLKSIDGRLFAPGDTMYFISNHHLGGVGEVTYSHLSSWSPDNHFYDKETAHMFVIGLNAIEEFLNPDYRDEDNSNTDWRSIRNPATVYDHKSITNEILRIAHRKVEGIEVFEKYKNLHTDYRK